MRHRTALAGTFAALALLAGCSKRPASAPKVHVRPEVRLVHPERRTITRMVGQPGFIEAYEQTSVYPKIAGYVEEWNVDIGDTIEKGEVLATLFVPELHAEHREKKAQVALDVVQIAVARQLVDVAVNNVEVAAAQVEEARAKLASYEADVERWRSEVRRLTGLTKVVNREILAESRKQLKASIAAREAGKASVTAAQASEKARQADSAKAKVDVQAAQARAKVTEAAEQRLAALVSYTEVMAPYDGAVVARNANTGDYVQPGTGDSSAPRSTRARPGARGAPLYVVARIDPVRIFLPIPELDANGVRRGSNARVRIQAVDDEEVAAKVTRVSRGLDVQSRTLRAEIDLPNPDGRILPGMYAYGEVRIERRNVFAVPLGAVIEIGNQNICYVYAKGKAVQVAVQPGINDGKWVEVVRKRVKGEWVPFTGRENVIVGDLSQLSDGEAVRVAAAAAGKR